MTMVNQAQLPRDTEVDDLAEKVGRIATEEMLVLDAWEREQVAIGGFHAVAMTLDAVCDHFEPEAVSAFMDRLRAGVARIEEQAS
jgi:hypothetical protein